MILQHPESTFFDTPDATPPLPFQIKMFWFMHASQSEAKSF